MVKKRGETAAKSWQKSLEYLQDWDSKLWLTFPSGFALRDASGHLYTPECCNGRFDPFIFLQGDEGTFLSLFETVASNFNRIFEGNYDDRQRFGESEAGRRERKTRQDRTLRESVLDPRLPSKVSNSLVVRGFETTVDHELARRVLRAVLGFEDNRDRPGTVAKARDWILKNTDPTPYIEHRNRFTGKVIPCPLRFLPDEPPTALRTIRRHLANYLKCQAASLTIPDESRDTEEVTKRQEREPESDPGSKLLEEGILPQTRRRGQDMFLTSYRGLNLPRLQHMMWKAARKSGLTLSEIAERMGLDTTGRNPRSQVYHLLRDAKDPGFFTVLRFCDAVGLSLDELLSSRKTKK